MRIPNKVVLPFGYHISDPAGHGFEMDRQDANADGIWDNEAKPFISASGFLLRDGVIICLHELGHAWLGLAASPLFDDGKARS